MVEMNCQRCKREWEYKGKAEWFTSCPRCKTSVKIPKKVTPNVSD